MSFLSRFHQMVFWQFPFYPLSRLLLFQYFQSLMKSKKATACMFWSQAALTVWRKEAWATGLESDVGWRWLYRRWRGKLLWELCERWLGSKARTSYAKCGPAQQQRTESPTLARERRSEQGSDRAGRPGRARHQWEPAAGVIASSRACLDLGFLLPPIYSCFLVLLSWKDATVIYAGNSKQIRWRHS